MNTQQQHEKVGAPETRNFRIKLTANTCDNVYYLTRRDGRLLLVNKGDTAHHFSSVTSKPAEFRFALEDAQDAYAVLEAVMQFCDYTHKAEII